MRNHLKIAYISITALSDCDLPLIHELSKGFDIDYYLITTNRSRQGTIINIQLKEDGGIFDGTQYPELETLQNWIDLRHIYIVNKPVNHDWEWLNFKVSWEWKRLLKSKDYDIIHITWPLRYCSFPLYFLHKKMVLTMHDPIPHSSHQTIENKIHRWCCMHFTPNFILLNKTQKHDFMRKYDIDESRIYISKLSIYTHLRHTNPAPSLCNNRYILYIGSILPHKGIEYLCEAMRPIISERKDINLIIAGKGQFYFDKSKYECNSNYSFINRFITNEELASLISNSIAVVCPYIDATQSGVIMSAFALNKPVIATKVGALAEMMEDGRHGYLVPPRDIAALTKAIQNIIQPGITQMMSKNIEKDYSSGGKLSWEEIAIEMTEIYKQIINKRIQE